MEPVSFMSAFWNMVAALAIVLVILITVMFLLRKLLRSGSSLNDDGKIIKIITSHQLGPKNSLVLLDVLGKYILIAISNQQVSYLTCLEEADIQLRLKAITDKSRVRSPENGFWDRCRKFARQLIRGGDN